MKTARLLLASLSLAVLTACGSETITSPSAAPSGASRNITGGDTTTETNNVDSSDGGFDIGCAGTLVTVTSPTGVVTVECVTEQRGPTMGSGT
ncbi:MAG TPA: hypothetical protein VE913_07950 [Longimicrobium sp.]|nr:hypothetical protein [Longimicrobium sp.]